MTNASIAITRHSAACNSSDRVCGRALARLATTVMLLLAIPAVAGADAAPAPGTRSTPDVTAAAARDTSGDAFRLPIFVNNSVTVVYGADYRTPFIANVAQPRGADIARTALEFGHVDAWKYGHNLAEIIVRRSNASEPAAGGGSGATEFYAILRSGISINRMAQHPLIRLGPLRDIDLQAGADLQTKNTAFAPSERTLFLGARLLFILGTGYFNVGLHARKEWNHNGALGTSENYEWGLNVEPSWSFPFHVGRLRFVFDGYADYNAAKGRDAFGRPTASELLARPQLKIDIGSALGHRANIVQLGVGIEYWHNMFGKNSNSVPGANQTTPILSLAIHWGGHRAPETDARSELR